MLVVFFLEIHSRLFHLLETEEASTSDRYIKKEWLVIYHAQLWLEKTTKSIEIQITTQEQKQTASFVLF